MSKSKEEMTRSLFLILGCVLWIQGGGFRVYGVLKGFVFTVLMDGPWVGFRGDGHFLATPTYKKQTGSRNNDGFSYTCDSENPEPESRTQDSALRGLAAQRLIACTFAIASDGFGALL